MATVITSECINCGACEPECPNTAIYQGGVEWEFNGKTHPALSAEIFYIVPEKCTECVGFYDHEACAAVCPVDCCVPDPNRPESEDVLMVRAKELHPETQFPANFPSRFRKEAAGAAGDGAAAASGAPAGAPAPGGAAPPAPAGAGRAAGPGDADLVAVIPALEDFDVPLECFRCSGAFAVPFGYLRAGTVFNCPHCHGSYVPTIPLCQAVGQALRSFHETYTRRARELQERRQRELDRFTEEQRRHLEAFEQRLRELSRSVRPPGAPHKRRPVLGSA
jgi:ferredoxin